VFGYIWDCSGCTSCRKGLTLGRKVDECKALVAGSRRPPGCPGRRFTMAAEGGAYPIHYVPCARQVERTGAKGGGVLPQRGVRGRGPSEGLQGLPAVQDRPVLRRRVSDTGLDDG